MSTANITSLVDRHRVFHVRTTTNEIPNRGAKTSYFCTIFPAGENPDQPQDGVVQEVAAGAPVGLRSAR